MKRFSACAAALVCTLALFSTVPSASAVEADELTFAMIAGQNATKQWTMTMATGNLASPTFTPVNCSKPALGACTSTNPALMQDTGDLLRVTYTLANLRGAGGVSLKTYNNAEPTKVQLRLCFTMASSVDRAWRKKNKPYPRLSQNCPLKFYEGPFNGSATNVDVALNSGTHEMNFNNFDEIPTATHFLMMWVYCGDSVCAFETTEGAAATAVAPAVPGNFVETKVELGITPGMRAAAIILSIFGPAFFIIFYAADTIYYRKTGKPILFF